MTKIILGENHKGMTKAQVTKLLNDETTSKSSKMKSLFLDGYSVKQVSEMLEVRYNFAYNVISNMIAVEGLTVESSKQDTKKDAIIGLFLAGYSNKQIQVDLKANYNYVYNTIKKYKLDNPDWQTKVTVKDTVAE